MKELIEYRVNLMQRLEESAKAFRQACLAMKDPYAPLEEGGWNVHQIAVHLRDTDKLIFGLRARQTALEDNPEFSPFDSDAYMTEHYDPKESLSEVLNDFVASIEALVELLRSLPAGAWSRLSRHTTLGTGLTMQSWVEKDLAHIEEHLDALKKASNK
jgi:hypothetical protein